MKIDSEIGKLKRVILHEPSLEIERLTPFNCDEFLFDDVIWMDRAQEEHQQFQKLLKENGVEVLLVEKLLSETIENLTARNWILEKVVKRLQYNYIFKEEIFNYLYALSAKTLAKYLIGGLTFKELGVNPTGLVGHCFNESDFVLPPLPNHLFTRDTSVWIGHGVLITRMAKQARMSESINISAIYKFHHLFAKEHLSPILYDGIKNNLSLPSIEGGDVLALNKDVVIVGLSERTTAAAIEHLAQSLFSQQIRKRVIAIEIPKKRAYMHLDTVMTMIGHDTFAVGYPIDQCRSWSIVPGDTMDHMVVEPIKNIYENIASLLGVKKLRIISPGGDIFTQHREQWTDASNLLAVAPNVVFGYDRNVYTNSKLKKEGITVIPIPSGELSRGRGGTRCMSCPIDRE